MSFVFFNEMVSPHIRRLILPGDVYAYLVEGNRLAALIDTGCGLGDLRTYVESLTPKPLIVLLTHGHLDHAPGAIQFDTVYMSPLDEDIFADHDRLQRRISYLDGTSAAGHYSRADLLPECDCSGFLPLFDGELFDLGGLHIEVFSCAGHTPGSMAFLFQEEQKLLLGDACNPFTFLFDKSSLGLSSYEQNLQRLLQNVQGRYREVLLSHGEGHPSTAIIEETIQVCQAIKAGCTDNSPLDFGERKGWLAFPKDRKSERGELMGNIVFDIHRIEE